ncbi:MAG TPA: universal stress protein [Candidatus Competibacteraceae bacterium]|nr:universal stress protein [Candidatus Competibacteraceae bacterium]
MPSAIPTIRKILVATDAGPRAGEVLRPAVALAAACGAELHILRAVEPLNEQTIALVSSYMPPERLEQLRRDTVAEMQHRLQTLIAELGAEGRVAALEVREGHAAPLILERARELGADLIVLGSHGQSVLGEMVMGSVAHKITMQSPIPVLLVPIRGE